MIGGNIYRSPSGSVPSFLQILDEVLEIIQLHSCEFVIMGDINLNLCGQRSSSFLDFLSTILTCRTSPSACIPARITETTAASLLDSIFSSLTLVQNFVLTSDISDHFPVFSTYDFSDSLPRRSQEAGFSCLKFCDQVASSEVTVGGRSWSISENESNTDSLFNLFYDPLKEITLDTCDTSQSNPTSKRTVPLNPWKIPGLFKGWRKKNNLWKAYRSSKPFLRYSRLIPFKAYRRVYNSLCRKGKSLL